MTRARRGVVALLVVLVTLGLSVVWSGAVARASEPVGYTLVDLRRAGPGGTNPVVVDTTADLVREWTSFGFRGPVPRGPSWPADVVHPARVPVPIDFRRQVVAVFQAPGGQHSEELLGAHREGDVVWLDFARGSMQHGSRQSEGYVVALDRVDLPVGEFELQVRLDGEVDQGTQVQIGPVPRWRATGGPVGWQVVSRVTLYGGMSDTHRRNRAPLRPVLVSSRRELGALWDAFDPGVYDGRRLEHWWGPQPEDLDFGESVAVVFTTVADNRASWEVAGVRNTGGGRVEVELGYVEQGRLDGESIVELWVVVLDREGLPPGEVELAVVGPDGYPWQSSVDFVGPVPGSWVWPGWWPWAAVAVLAAVARRAYLDLDQAVRS